MVKVIGSRSLPENTHSNNKSLTKGACKHCLNIKDTINQLIEVKIGKSEHLFCPVCSNYYCIHCNFKETIIKAKNYPYCFRCSRRIKNLFRDPEPKHQCVKSWCTKPATISGLIYNEKTDDMITGYFCRKHYDHFYYYLKLKTSKKCRVSFGKAIHTQKRTNNRNLI